MVPGMDDDDDDEWAEPTPTQKAQEEEERCEFMSPLLSATFLVGLMATVHAVPTAQAASSGLAARLEAAFAAEEKRKQLESESKAKPVRVVAPPDDDDYEFDEDAIEADEDAYFNPGPSAAVSAPASSSARRDSLDDEADEFF